MKFTKTISTLIVSMILLSCFISLYTAQPVAAVSNTRIIFNQTGLASGTSWTVKIGSSNYSSTGSSISQTWIDGVPYNWEVYVPAGYTSSSTLSGIFTLSFGETKNINVVFTSAGYNVVFSQSSLPSGTNWAVTFDGTTKTSVGSAIIFTNVASGTHIYNVTSPTGYLSSATSGQITVDGNEDVPLTFTAQSDLWWTSGNGVAHTGYSTSTGPLTNTTLWTQHYGMGMMSSYSTPAVIDGIMYLTTGDYNSLYLVNATTGSLITTITSVPLSGYSSPTVIGDVIYINGQDHAVYAVNATTGNVIWSYTTGDFLQAPPAVENGVLYIGSADNHVYALNATDGTLIWSHPTSGSVWRTPTIANNIVYAVTFNSTLGSMVALNITTGQELWSYGITNCIYISTPVDGYGIVYAAFRSSSDVGKIVALNATTGAEVWSNEKTSWGSPALAHGIVYFATVDRYLNAFNATTGSQIWSTPFSGLSPAQPIITDDVVYYKTDRKMYAFDAVTGETLWTYEFDMMMAMDGRDAAPALSNGLLYVPTGEGYVFAFGSLERYDLTVATVGQGSVSPGNQTSIYAGTTLNLVAIPDEGWTFEGWSGDASGTTNTTITMNSDKSVTATFTEAPPVNLTMLTTGQGSVIPGNASYSSGSSVDLKAIPAAGWSFSGWTGDASGSENTTITMNSNKTVTATFTQDSYYLSMITVGHGSVNPGNNSYASGTTIDIEAINELGWTFNGWSGVAEGLSNTTITMNANKTVTATFTQNNYTLTMITLGNGNVTPGNQTSYYYGDNVGITAMSAYPYVFSGWSGSTSGNTNKTITITGNMTITATFAINSHTITVTQGSHGTITPSTATVNDGGSQTFTISPDIGYHIVDVIVDSSSVGSVTSYQFANAHEDHTITATFAPNEYTLTITTVGNGSVTATPATSTYHYGDTVQLNAIPNNGWTFNGWSGDTSGTTNTTITIDGNKNIIANFTQNSYQISFALTGANATGVVLTVDGVGYTATDLPTTFSWLYNSVHTFAFNSTLPVSNGEQYVWTSASGLSTIQSGSLIVTESGTITASFDKQYLLTVTTAHGSATGEGWYIAGTSATVSLSQSTVTSGTDTRYIFDGWTGNAQGIQSLVSIAMDEPKTVTANWETQYRVTVTTNPSSSGTTTPSTVTWMPAGTLEISCTTNTGYQFTSWASTPQVTITTPTATATTVTINGPGTITANFNQTIETVYIKTSDGKTKELTLTGNISASQLSNGKITTALGTQTTKIAFTATGPSGTSGFTNMTIPKSSVTYGTRPVVYIDGEAATNQGYTQDYYNYYVWFTTHFSTHEVSIDFTSNEIVPTPTQQPSTNDFALPAAFAVAIIALVIAGLFVQQRRKHKN
jgi:uncharacterized repeat protein (TIGR02543 family)